MARHRPARPAAASRGDSAPRIIGGRLRGKRLKYSGDIRTRPMKDRVREAAFNLIGPVSKSAVAIDLFAGTGALALEAVSRGAERAVMIERHFPSAKIIQENVDALGLTSRCLVVAADAFHWVRHDLSTVDADRPWLVFCSPPFSFYEERRDEMIELLDAMQTASPAGSLLVVEFDRSFSAEWLPLPDQWDIRPYPPAVIAVWTK